MRPFQQNAKHPVKAERRVPSLRNVAIDAVEGRWGVAGVETARLTVLGPGFGGVGVFVPG
jgi:hypothetical protein